jgi:CheY-like chemotaxis protein
MDYRYPVLVVEDDPDTRDSIAEILQDEGYDAELAGNGREALDRLEVYGDRPMLILLDMMMPVMDGRAFIKEMRRSNDLSRIPVLVFSAHADLRAVARELGVAGCLTKPLRRDELVDAVASFKQTAALASGHA